MTMQGDRQTRPGRTIVGTVWRTVVVLAAAACAIAAAAWLGSHLAGYDERLAMIPAIGVAAVLASIVVAAVDGHRRPRDPAADAPS